jgi:hypothetical protein
VTNERTSACKLRSSRNSLRLILGLLRSVLNVAVEDGLISDNPAAKIGRFTKSEKPAHKATAMTRWKIDA